MPTILFFFMGYSFIFDIVCFFLKHVRLSVDRMHVLLKCVHCMSEKNFIRQRWWYLIIPFMSGLSGSKCRIKFKLYICLIELIFRFFCCYVCLIEWIFGCNSDRQFSDCARVWIGCAFGAMPSRKTIRNFPTLFLPRWLDYLCWIIVSDKFMSHWQERGGGEGALRLLPVAIARRIAEQSQITARFWGE